MGIHTINKSEASSLEVSFEKLKNNPIKSNQWFEELNELRTQAKSQDKLRLWIEISNVYVDSGKRNAKIKESLLIVNEVLKVIDLPFWNTADKEYLKLRGNSLAEAGGLYNALHLPNEALVYIEKAGEIARSMQDDFLLIKILMCKEASLNIKGNHEELCAFQLKNIEFYRKFVEKHPDQINTLLISYTNIELGYHNVRDEKNKLIYIKKAYELLDKTVDPNRKVYILSIYILLLLDKENIEDKELLKAESLFQKLASIDKKIIDEQMSSLYLLAQGYIQAEKKDYQSAKKTFYKVIKSKVYSNNNQAALTKAIEIYHLENNLEGVQNCLKLQREMLSLNYNHLKLNEIAKQEALYQVKQLQIEANYNQKILKGERELREKIEDKQDKILNLNKELDFFTGMAAHDLKAPLRTINNFLDLIYQKNQENFKEQNQKFFDFIFDATDQMTTLVDKLLSHAKMGGIGIALEPIELDDQLLKVKANLQAAIDEKKVTIIIDPLPQIIGEANYIKVLFQNLLSNAIKFNSNDQPLINIYTKETESHYCIYVKDNGIGIPKDHLSKIMRPFFRIHAQDKYKGAGLGLATCQKIMNIHQGNLSVKSKEGQGSTFQLNFPKSVKLNVPHRSEQL